MTEQAKPTPGPWIVRAPDNGIYDTEDEIANVVARGPYGLITLAEEVDIADARLIAEAGTVYHETGLTPRQLAELVADMLGPVLCWASEYANRHGIEGVHDTHQGLIDRAKPVFEAIAKARGGSDA